MKSINADEFLNNSTSLTRDGVKKLLSLLPFRIYYHISQS